MPEVHDFVERELQRAAVRPISLEAVYRRRDRRQRNRRVGAGLVGVAVAIAVVLAATRAHLLADRVPAEPTPTPPPTAEWHYGDDALVDVQTGHATALPSSIHELTKYNVAPNGYEVSPDGAMLAVAGNGIYVASIDGTNVRKVAGYDGVGVLPRWSPDSTKIVYEIQSDLIIVDVPSGETTTIADLPQIVGSPTFGPNGDTIIYTARSGDRRELRTIPVTGGSTSLLRKNAEFGAVSPDGTHLAYWRTGRSFEGTTGVYGVEIVDLTDGTTVEPRVFTGYTGCWAILCDVDPPAPEWSPNGRRLVFSHEGSTFVMDANTGDAIKISSSAEPSWLNNQTLIVESYSPDDRAG